MIAHEIIANTSLSLPEMAVAGNTKDPAMTEPATTTATGTTKWPATLLNPQTKKILHSEVKELDLKGRFII